MPHKSESGLLLSMQPSPRLIKTVIFIHTLALGAGIANALTLGVKIGLCIFICGHGWWTVRRLNAEHYTIKHTEALGWQLLNGNDVVSIEILKSTVITTFALFLHFKYASTAQTWKAGSKKTRLILNDALADEDYRRLIVKLKTTAI